MSKPERIVVRVLRGTCADEETCAAVTRVEHDTQWRYMIGEPVSDPAILAAHADRMAPHEVLVRYPVGLIPEIDHL
jgi:hypothetical protein